MIKVLTVDDHPILCQALARGLKTDPAISVVGAAHDGRTAVELAKEIKPDVILMDLDLPVINGLEAMQLILKQIPATKVIVFSSYESKYVIHEALKAKTNGYLIKACPVAEIAKAIKKVHAGSTYFTSVIAKKMTQMYPLNTLTTREYEVFKFLSKEKNVQKISEDLNISPRTIRLHEKNIHKKLSLKNNKDLILFAIELGFFDLD